MEIYDEREQGWCGLYAEVHIITHFLFLILGRAKGLENGVEKWYNGPEVCVDFFSGIGKIIKRNKAQREEDQEEEEGKTQELKKA